MSIGERICALRKEKNISQAELSRLLDVTRQAVSKWENDLTAPDTIKLIQLADALDTDVEYLATGNHSTIKSPPAIVTNVVERIVEKPVVVEKTIEVEKVIEKVIEKPVIRKAYRTRYLRNPLEFILAGLAGLIIGLVIGLMI